jgi:hypothetical protein
MSEDCDPRMVASLCADSGSTTHRAVLNQIVDGTGVKRLLDLFSLTCLAQYCVCASLLSVGDTWLYFRIPASAFRIFRVLLRNLIVKNGACNILKTLDIFPNKPESDTKANGYLISQIT